MPRLLFFTDPARTPRADLVVARMPRGSGVVFRAFGAKEAAKQGAALARAARRRGVVFLVGADPRLAIALGAGGLHLPERMTTRAGDIRLLRRRFLVTGAVHGLPAALRARRAGVDAVVLSSVFPSRSPSAGRAMGVLAFAALARKIRIPVFALGGITPGNARRLGHSGAIGLAAVEGFTAPAATEDQNLKVVSRRTRGAVGCGSMRPTSGCSGVRLSAPPMCRRGVTR